MDFLMDCLANQTGKRNKQQEMIVLLENLSWTFIMSYPKTAPDISSSSTEKPNQMAKPIPETWKA